MKKLIVSFLLLFAVPAFAGDICEECEGEMYAYGVSWVVAAGGPAAAGTTGDLWNETFENAFDETWTTEGYDSFQSDSGAGGASTYAAELTAVDGAQFLGTALEEFSDVEETYHTFWVKVDVNTAWNNSNYLIVYLAYNSSTGNELFNIQFRTDGSGNKKILGYYYTGSSESTGLSTNDWVDNTWYQFKVYYKNGDFLNGDSTNCTDVDVPWDCCTGSGTGTCTGGEVDIWWSGGGGEDLVLNDTSGAGNGRDLSAVRIGVHGDFIAPTDTDVRIDRMSIDTSGYVDAE